MPRLARLLRRLGDLPESAIVPEGSRLYDGALVEAVERFQERHGLRAVGYLDLKTIEQLNVPMSYRVEQIQLGASNVIAGYVMTSATANRGQYPGISSVCI